MVDHYHEAWKKAFRNVEKASEAAAEHGALGLSKGRWESLRGSIDGARAAGGRFAAAGVAIKGGFKYPFQKAGDFLKAGARAIKGVPGFKLGGYAAGAAVGVSALAYATRSGQTRVDPNIENEVPLPDGTVAMANFSAPKTMMGLEPVEGEHVNRLGRGGAQRFQDQVVPSVAERFEDVSTTPQR